jgi:hypothetical protein
MGERFYYFWLRFRWLIVLAGVVLPLVAGFLAGTLGGSSPQSTSVTSTTLAAKDAEVLAGGASALAACDGITETDELFACRINLQPRTPVVLREDASAFLVDGAWRSFDGSSDVIAADGVPDAALNELVSGFTADLDNDGSVEYVLVTGTEDGVLRVLSRVPGGGLRDTAPARGLDRVTRAALVLPLDANRDGWMDLLVSSALLPEEEQEESATLTRGIYLLVNGGWRSPGAFETVDAVRVGVEGSASTASLPVDDIVGGSSVDLDRDGFLDVVLLGRQGKAAVHWGAGSLAAWSSSRATDLLVPVGATSLTSGDLDVDGRDELLISYDVSLSSAYGTLCTTQLDGRPCTPYPGLSATGGVAVLRQGDGRSFAPDQERAVVDVARASDVTLTDIDGDGLVDLLVSREAMNAEGGVVVHRGTPGADGGIAAFVRGEVIGRGAVGRIRAVDLDANGALDLVMTGRGEERAQLWKNTYTPVRHVRLAVRGAASLSSVGSTPDAIGARVTISDLDNKVLTITLGQGQLTGDLLIPLPLRDGAWSGREAVPTIEVFFPATGRTRTLSNVATGALVDVVEPGE